MIPAAFYAPMKPPTHPVPSGDRAMGRALLSALDAAGVRADLASKLRSREGAGDAAAQEAIFLAAEAELPQIIAAGRAAGWRIWITYHNYYKAPDFLGPRAARALGIPYLQIESTRARKRLNGAWARFARAAEDAADTADAVAYFTAQDEEALRAYAPPDQSLFHLHPFLPRSDLPDETTRSGAILSVGMFRAGDKLASYRIVADTLAQLRATDWQLEIAGDGPAREDVMQLMSPFGAQVRFLGELDADALHAAYARSRLLFWPGVHEAFGMSYLEAQATGLTVLAQDRPGVRDVLAPNAAYPNVDAGSAALAARLDLLLSNEKLVKKLGEGARIHVARHHLLTAASARLRALIEEILSR